MNVPRIRPPPDIVLPAECRALVDGGALVALNTSGGKDSQAMTILLSRLVPRDQLLAVHAPLGEVEWPGTIEHIERTLPPGVPLILAPVASGKTLLEAIEERGRFPDSARRYCTSGWKRGPIERELRRYLKAHPRFGGPHRERDGDARGRKPGAVQAHALDAQRPQQPGRPAVVRLAADPRPFGRRRVPRHRRGRAIPALGLRRRHVPAELLLLHPGLAGRICVAPPSSGRRFTADTCVSSNASATRSRRRASPCRR